MTVAVLVTVFAFAPGWVSVIVTLIFTGLPAFSSFLPAAVSFSFSGFSLPTGTLTEPLAKSGGFDFALPAASGRKAVCGCQAVG